MERNAVFPDHEHLDKITYSYDPSGDLTVSSYTTPAFCIYCKSQIDGFFPFRDNDHKASITCNHCGETNYFLIGDQDTAELYMSSHHIFHDLGPDGSQTISRMPIVLKDIYFLNEGMLEKVQECTGINFFFETQEIELSKLIKKVCSETGISYEDLSEKDLGLHPLFPTLPPLVNKWLHLLTKIECI
ncbi:hypothetical protein LRR81_19905 [Metabacillus sp. GX 13764]|uniref:hypothetical protein n=1 Tax=Metabacillus kandeliae TaxID=2900151 RepID=UPI001E3B0E2E|nr:hypothetical protein [Metabacillus kandeliae]MCD7036517.1 hypothetical protein [Metabacillus kandeliae]